MKIIGKCFGLGLAAAAALALTVPAHAANYTFTTAAPQSYYESTSYEDVYGSQYSTNGFVQAGLQPAFGISTEQTVPPALLDGVAVEASESAGTLPVICQPAFTSVSGMVRADGSIGTLSIPRLGINMKVWEGETNASMAKGVAHYSSTSGWAGNVCLCGHNRGAKYVIGNIKDLKAGDVITYATVYGTRAYQVTMVKIIANTDWSYLQPTPDDRITITTCLADHPESRVCVQAVQVGQ